MDLRRGKELSVPFSNLWYSCEFCSLGKRKGEWAFHFSGEVTPYQINEVGFEIYRDFRALPLPEPFTRQQPDAKVLQFLQKWGPLGLYYKNYPRLEGLEDYWPQYHTRKSTFKKLVQEEEGFTFDDYETSKMNAVRPDSVFTKYFETWQEVSRELVDTQALFRTIDDPDSEEWYGMEPLPPLRIFNTLVGASSLYPVLIQTGEGKYEWSFAFDNLIDALIGLQGQKIIGKVNIRHCDYCGKAFDASEKKKGRERHRFCDDDCLADYYTSKKSSDPVIKERRKLQARLNRRKGISEETVKGIEEALLAAETVEDLNAIVKKYKDILEVKRGKKK